MNNVPTQKKAYHFLLMQFVLQNLSQIPLHCISFPQKPPKPSHLAHLYLTSIPNNIPPPSPPQEFHQYITQRLLPKWDYSPARNGHRLGLRFDGNQCPRVPQNDNEHRHRIRYIYNAGQGKILLPGLSV